MSVASHSLSAQVQRLATELSARLAQVAKDPPDLAGYLRIHAECLAQGLHPVGLAYEMASGQGFQRAFAYNYDSLRLQEAPEQAAAFQRALKLTIERNAPVHLDANSAPNNPLPGLKLEDVPAPEAIPLYNKTRFQQVFVPIPLNKRAIGVVHAWFEKTDQQTAHARLSVTAHAAAEIELYLKARRISDISVELSRLGTYARFLEDVAGDQDIESVSWKLVNYARESVGCDRVCLLLDRRYGLATNAALPGATRLELQACSGLRKPHPRSEQADVLREHASELLKLSAGMPDATHGAPSEGKKEGAEKKAPAADAKALDERPPMRIVFTHRDPSKSASRPDAVNRYFDVMPMNWSTTLPLFDRDNRVCGTLLFEGLHYSDQTGALFAQMRDLAVSGGRAVATALVWDRRRTLKIARGMMGWRNRMLATPRRQLVVRYLIPAILAVALLAFPFPYRVKGEATLRPVEVRSLAALTTGRLLDVSVRVGERVKAGQVICTIDSRDLQLQLRQVEQERERALTEASLALRQQRSETQMQIARLAAEKAATMAEKLRRDIENAVIVSPIDGILVGPQDFSQRRGEVIRAGETVAEVVSPEHWEVKVTVSEKDLPTLANQTKQRAEGVPGELVLAANPDQRYQLLLHDADSFAHRLDLAGGRYAFSAVLPLEARVQDALPGTIELKSGYSGRVRFKCGRRPLAQILFGDFIRFLKLHFF